MTWVVHCKQSDYDVYIGRPTKSGNVFSHLNGTLAQHKVASREEAIAKYEEWLIAQPELVAEAKAQLKGKVLGCWCHPLACHGDVLSRIANEP